MEVGEWALASVDSQFEAFELLQLLYFLTISHYQLSNISRGFALVADWKSRIVTESVPSQCALQSLEAEKKCWEGSNVEAAEQYEAALHTFGASSTYIAVYSRYTLGWLNAALNRQERALRRYLEAAFLYPAHFPHTL